MKKVLLVNGSPHKNGNTAAALSIMEEELARSGLETVWFRRAGATPSIDRINKYFTFSQMPVVSSDYWNGYLGAQDSFGISLTCRTTLINCSYGS